jgi:hypothetical protein
MVVHWSTPPWEPDTGWLCSCLGGWHSPGVRGPRAWLPYTWRGSETWRCQAPYRFMAKEIHHVSRLSTKATDSEESKSTLPRWTSSTYATPSPQASRQPTPPPSPPRAPRQPMPPPSAPPARQPTLSSSAPPARQAKPPPQYYSEGEKVEQGRYG